MKIQHLFLFASLTALSAKAFDLDGYIMPSFGYQTVMVGDDTAGFVGRMEFARISRGFAMDLRAGKNTKYLSYGSTFRLFENWELGERQALQTGVGLGAHMSDMNSAADKNFWEPLATVFAKYVFQINEKLAIGLEPELEGTSKRANVKGTPEADNSTRMRLNVSLGLLSRF